MFLEAMQVVLGVFVGILLILMVVAIIMNRLERK